LIGPVEAFLLNHELFPEYKDTNKPAGELCNAYLNSLVRFEVEVYTNKTHYHNEKMVIIRHRACFPGNVGAITALVAAEYNKDMNFRHLDCKHGECTKESTNGNGGYCDEHVPTVSWLFVVFVFV
jgi:hypothetical protein